MINEGDIVTEELESEQFREALLLRLNGQTENMQRLVKLVDTRFKSHARRMREHRQAQEADQRVG